jgi:2-methylcitrate dehydratase PrpD
MQPGFAAQSALVSVELARRNVRGAQDTFEGADGFLRVYLRDRCDRAALRDRLGERYEFTQLSYKPYPCCRFNHTAIDAALALRASPGIRAERVRRIRVGVNRQAYEAVCTPVEVRKVPRTVVHAQFSIPFTVAAALTDGCVQLGHFDEASLKRADIVALAQRVDAFVEDDIEREWSRTISPAQLHVEMDDGTMHSWRVDWPLGHPRRPMSAADFDAKAKDCLRASVHPLRGDSSRRLRDLIDGLELLDDVAALARVLESVQTAASHEAVPTQTKETK